MSIVNARANVMVYDEQQKKWLPSGNTQGMAKVQVYHHTVNNTYRVVGRKINDHAVSCYYFINKFTDLLFILDVFMDTFK